MDQSRGIGKALLWLGETSVFIAFCSAIAIASTYATFHHQVDWILVAFVFSATLYTYNIQRRLDKHYTKSILQNDKNSLIVASAVAMLWLVFELNNFERVAYVILGFISIAYVFPTFKLKGKPMTLRAIPFVKIYVIVLVWVFSTVFIPLMGMSPRLELAPLLIFLVQQTCFIAALTIPFDIRDVKADAPEQRTLPMILGKKKAMNLSIAFCTIAGLLACTNYFAFGEYSIPMVTAYLASFIVTVLLLQKGNWKSPIFYTIYLDGMILVQGGMVILAYFI
jgi:hypothetical protein